MGSGSRPSAQVEKKTGFRFRKEERSSVSPPGEIQILKESGCMETAEPLNLQRIMWEPRWLLLEGSPQALDTRDDTNS